MLHARWYLGNLEVIVVSSLQLAQRGRWLYERPQPLGALAVCWQWRIAACLIDVDAQGQGARLAAQLSPP